MRIPASPFVGDLDCILASDLKYGLGFILEPVVEYGLNLVWNMVLNTIWNTM